jgi:hypothetical protein
VLSLQLHLPDMHMVSFHQHEGVRRVLNRPGVERSMLTACFEKNSTFEHAHGILYRDFSEYYSGTHREKNGLEGCKRII